MAVAKVQTRSAGFANSTLPQTLAFSGNVTGGNTLVACVTNFSTVDATLTVSDNLNGNWTRCGAYAISGSHRASIWYRSGTNAGACTVTVTPGGQNFITLAIHEYSGLLKAVSLLDGTNSAHGTSTSAATGTVPAVRAGELVVACAGYNGSEGGSPTVGAPLSLRETVVYSAGVQLGLSTADDVAAPASEGATFTSASSVDWIAAGASFFQDQGAPDLEAFGGPALLGSPWSWPFRVPVTDQPLSAAFAAPPPPTPTAYGQEVVFPPIAGGPWPLAGRGPMEFGFPAPSRPRPRDVTTAGRGKGRVSLSRVLDATTSDGRNRLRRFTEELSSWFNDLTARGVIRFNGPSDWTLMSQAHEAAADPGVADDGLHGFFVGAMWVNTASHQAFVCTSAAAGAAVWKQVTA